MAPGAETASWSRREQAARLHEVASREALARAFLSRSMRLIEHLAAQAPSEVLESALASPSDLGGLATALSEYAGLAEPAADDPLAEAFARGAALKEQLLADAGGGLTVSQAARALGVTRQAVDRRRVRGTILAVPTANGEHLYPAFQFTDAGLLPGLGRILRAFEVKNPWTRLSVLLAPDPALDGRTMLEALREGDVELVEALAEGFGEQGG